jgi:hypothetical protein
MGLGSKDSSLTMNVHEMDVLSSFLEKIETLNGSSSIEVDVKRLDGIWTDILGENSRPFVKMDTQGFEMEIITGLGDRASEVIGWQIELSVEPLYKGQPRIEDVIGTMRSLEVSLWKIVPGLRVPSTLRSLEYDGIFFRNS